MASLTSTSRGGSAKWQGLGPTRFSQTGDGGAKGWSGGVACWTVVNRTKLPLAETMSRTTSDGEMLAFAWLCAMDKVVLTRNPMPDGPGHLPLKEILGVHFFANK